MNTNNTNNTFAAAASATVENFVPASVKNLGRPGNNSAIFEYHAEEKEAPILKEVLAVFTFGDTVAEFRDQSVVIKSAARRGKTTTMFRFSEARGALSALSAIHRGQYEIMEVGFHASKNKATLTANYNGENAELLAMKPTAGLVVLEKDMGEWYIAQRILKNNIPAYEKNESDGVKEMRARYWKHRALDMILSGETLVVSPQFYSVNDANEREYDHEATKKYIAKFMGGLCMTREEAREAYQQAVAVAETRRHETNIYNALKTGKLTVDNGALFSAVIDLRDGQSIIANDLVGKEVFKYKGNIRLNTSPFRITSENLAQTIRMMQTGGVSLALSAG